MRTLARPSSDFWGVPATSATATSWPVRNCLPARRCLNSGAFSPETESTVFSRRWRNAALPGGLWRAFLRYREFRLLATALVGCLRRKPQEKPPAFRWRHTTGFSPRASAPASISLATHDWRHTTGGTRLERGASRPALVVCLQRKAARNPAGLFAPRTRLAVKAARCIPHGLGYQLA